MKRSHFDYSLLDIWSIIVDINVWLTSEQQEKYIVYMQSVIQLTVQQI